ncbi:MAG: hypothetical protein IAE95_03195 [Chitinophagaceae bacterium]|nr:hypothetical protein [Chitinophagaceae bacterium]
MKMLLFLLLFLAMMQGNTAYAGFVLPPRAQIAVVDSPVAARREYGHRAHFVPTKQVRGIALLAFVGGLLSVAGLVAIIALWPLAFWPALLLGVGTFVTGGAAILLADADGRNIKPHMGLSLTGGLLAFVVLLPVLLPLSVLVLFYTFFDQLLGRRRSHRGRYF